MTEDITGRTFGEWIVLGRSSEKRNRNILWSCRCSCGLLRNMEGSSLKSGRTNKCKQCENNLRCVHGESRRASKTREWSIWTNMIQRCMNPKAPNYKNYGGRGIYICVEWLADISNFINDMGRSPSDDHSLDRIDNDGPYCKLNCRWATAKEQLRKTRRSRFLTLNGKTQCISAWAEELGITRNIIGWRFHHGWPIEKVLSSQKF